MRFFPAAISLRQMRSMYLNLFKFIMAIKQFINALIFFNAPGFERLQQTNSSTCSHTAATLAPSPSLSCGSLPTYPAGSHWQPLHLWTSHRGWRFTPPLGRSHQWQAGASWYMLGGLDVPCKTPESCERRAFTTDIIDDIEHDFVNLHNTIP